jgi:hypothetical protein
MWVTRYGSPTHDRCGLFTASPQAAGRNGKTTEPLTEPGDKAGLSQEDRPQSDCRTSYENSLGGVAPVFHSRTPPIHSRSARPSFTKTMVCESTRLECRSAAVSGVSPEMPLTAAAASYHGIWQPEPCSGCRDLSTGHCQSALSSLPIVPGTTRKHADKETTALQSPCWPLRATPT